MQANLIHDITFETEETIKAATIANSNEIVMLMSSGNVVRFNLQDKKGQYLFSIKSNGSYRDGGFDINAKSSIYTLDDIVVVVNDFKTHGFVHYPTKYRALHLWRKDYHASISNYPIALYKNEDGVPHLIYGEAWNHVQIMNLDTRQILTASKSLIEEKAEERHIEFYKKHTEHNKLAWPRPYDYFFGKLFMSPNQKKFLSAGWAWGSCDSYKVYDIEHFITSNRILDLNLDGWEHENRPSCWVDNETIAITYNPFKEGDENSTEDTPCEIHFYKINADHSEIENKIQIVEKDIPNSKIYFDQNINSFVLLSNTDNLSVISLDGETIFKIEKDKVCEYNIETNCFLVVDEKTISVYELKV